MRVALPLVAALTAAALSVLAWPTSAQAMDFSYRLYKGRVVIDATGSIEQDDFQRLLVWIRGLPPDVVSRITKAREGGPRGNAIVFNSPGGLVGEGISMGSFIENYHLSTGVAGGGQCSSACVLAWGAGEHKSIAPDAYIGVHNASLDGVAGHSAANRLESLGVTGRMGRVLQHYHAPDNVITQMLNTPSDSIYYLNSDDLAAWNVTVVGDVANTPPPATPVGDLRQKLCAHLEHEFDAQTTIVGKTKPLSRAYDEALLRADVAGHILLDQNCPLLSRSLMQNFLDEALVFEHGPMAESMVR